MATQLDLQEQEQLDALKAFWKKFGNLITWTLIVALAGVAGYNGWQFWQRDQAVKSGAMFEELERASVAGDADRVGRISGDLRERFPRTAYAQQAGLLAARVQLDKGQADAARASLSWVAEKGFEAEMRTVARLRLAAIQLEAKEFDAALQTLAAAQATGFEALVADRRGDVLLAQGKPAEARAAYLAAWQAMDAQLDYRRLIEAKLTALGAPPQQLPSSTAANTAQTPAQARP